MRPSTIAPLLLLLLAVAAGPAFAQRRRPTLVILGDSFSDDGDGRPQTNESIPSPAQGYYRGRMSNGPVWSDYLASSTGINVVNVASKAATACRPPILNAGLPFPVPYLAEQVQMVEPYKVITTSNRAVVIFIGVNDISLLAQSLLMGQINFTQAMAAVPAINACVKEAAEGLVRFGFTKSMTVLTAPNTPMAPLWQAIFSANQVPPAVGQQFLRGVGTLIRTFNENLKKDVAELAGKYGRAKYQVYDLYNLVTAVAAEGPAYGFTNVTAACQPHAPFANVPGTPGNTILSTCEDPNSHLFWDYAHLTTAFHYILGNEMHHALSTNSDLFK